MRELRTANFGEFDIFLAENAKSLHTYGTLTVLI